MDISVDGKKLLSNVVQTLCRQTLTVLLGIGMSILLARTLGPEGNGLYAMTFFLPTMLHRFLNFGVHVANIYFLASKDVDSKTVHRTNFRIWILTSLLGFSLTSPMIVWKSDAWFPGVPAEYLWVSLLFFPLGMYRLLGISVLHGQQNFKLYNALSIIPNGVSLALAFFFLLVLKTGVVGPIVANIISQIVALGILLYVLKPQFSWNRSCSRYLKKCLNYGWKAHASNILSFVNYRADMFIINLFLGPVAVGLYVVGNRLAEKLWLLSAAVSTVILPKLSELKDKEDTRRILTPLVGRWVFILTFSAAVLLALAAPHLINILYGTAFQDSVHIVFWMLPGIVLWAVSRVMANDIAARGKPEINTLTAIVVVVTNVTLNLLWIPKYGVTGAARATSTAYCIDALLKFIIYPRVSDNSPFALFRWTKYDIKVTDIFFSKILK